MLYASECRESASRQPPAGAPDLDFLHAGFRAFAFFRDDPLLVLFLLPHLCQSTHVVFVFVLFPFPAPTTIRLLG
jgi:hypothetical protein